MPLICLLVFIVGGIYTVIRSKAAVTVDELGNDYCLFGPYNESSVQTEVEVMTPESSVMNDVIQSMRDKGMKVCTKVVFCFAEGVAIIFKNYFLVVP